jgi:type IX secretion system PorP/SprF family membrane protein
MRFAKYIALTGIFVLLYAARLAAQRLPQDALYLMQNIALNPAYTGGKGQWFVHGYYAKQWLQMNFPDYANISVHGNINPKANFGFYAVSEGMGLVRSVSAAISYAYRMPLGDYADLSLGLSIGGAYNYMDIAGMQALVPQDPALNNFANTMQPLISVGAVYESSLFFTGFALRNMTTQTKLDDVSDVLLPSEHGASVFTLGTFFKINNNLDILPSIMWQEDLTQNSVFDMTLSLIYKYNYRVGLSFRTGQPLWKTDDPANIPSYSIALGGEMFYNRFVFGYTFSMGLNSFVLGFLSKHAVSLGYYITTKVPYRGRVFPFKRHTEYCPVCYSGQKEY